MSPSKYVRAQYANVAEKSRSNSAALIFVMQESHEGGGGRTAHACKKCCLQPDGVVFCQNPILIFPFQAPPHTHTQSKALTPLIVER